VIFLFSLFFFPFFLTIAIKKSLMLKNLQNERVENKKENSNFAIAIEKFHFKETADEAEGANARERVRK